LQGGSVDKLAASRQEAGEWVRRLCGAVRQAVEADRVIAWLYDAPRQAVSPFAADDPSFLEDVPAEWQSVPLMRIPAAVAVLLEGTPVEIEDAQDDERLPAELAADLGMSSVRFEPLIVGTTVGMLSIEPAPRGANPELQSLLGTVAAAVGRVSSMLEGDRERAETAFLLELTEVAVKAPSLDEMLIAVCERTARFFDVRRATVLLKDDGRLVARASRYADGTRDAADWEQLRRTPDPLPAARAALDSGDPVLAGGTGSPLVGTWAAGIFEIQSLLAVPLGRPPGAIGALVLDDSEPERFSAEDVRLAVAIADHITPTIEQARTNDERSSHLQAATAIRRLLEEGARATSVEEAGEVLAKVTREAIRCEKATLLLRAEDDRIEHVRTIGADADFDANLRELLGELPEDEVRLWRITARQAKPIFVENASASRLLPEDLVEALSLKSYVALPLVSAIRPLGMVLCSHSKAYRQWTNEERRLVEQLALEGSLVVENAALRVGDQERMDELAHQAFHDSLTELPNRALFADRLEHAIARTNRRKAAVAVLFLDLDDFKPINDNYGHEAGDRLLTAVARRVKACVRPEDTVARLGGDEFTVLLEDIADVRYAIAVAERIEESLADPFRFDGHEASITASIGIAVSTGRESSPEDLLRNSDRAMYLAKRKGRARHQLFEDEAVEPTEDEDEAEPAIEVESESADPGAGALDPPIPADQEAAVEEITEAVSLEEPVVVEGVPEHESEREDEPEDEVEPEEEPEPPTEEGVDSLTAARRRRRRRFPPRR